MRYRPLGGTGSVVSAVSLALTDAPNLRRMEDWRDIIYVALEAGVNAFEIAGLSPAIVDGLGEALKSVERYLVFVSLRLGPTPTGRNFSAEHMALAVESTLARTGLDYLDLCLLDDPGESELSGEALAALKALRASGRTRLIGVGGQDPAIDFYVATGHFDALSMPYSLSSNWLDRHRLKAAAGRDMAVIAYDFWPENFRAPPEKKLGEMVKQVLWGKPKVVTSEPETGAYEFLHATPGWTAEDICLAYALTEPSIATVQIDAASLDRLTHLADITEKEMPNGVASRIEMARFGGQKSAG